MPVPVYLWIYCAVIMLLYEIHHLNLNLNLNFRRDVIAEPHCISLAFMSIAIVVFGLGCWLHYSPVNRSLASRLHVARIPRIDSLTSSIVAEWFQIEFEFDSDGNSQPLYVYIDRVKRQRFFASLNLIKKPEFI